MKKIRLFVFSAAAFGLLLSGPLTINALAGTAQTKCPVMGLQTDKNVYADYHGKRVYFCCTDCQAKFKADPEKYMKEMKSQGIEPEDVPK